VQKINCILILILLGVSLRLRAQKLYPQNRPNYHKRPYFFGFHLCFNRGRFDQGLRSNFFLPDSILTIESKPETGFHIGPTVHVRLHHKLSLRFLPGYAFQDRVVSYTLVNRKLPGNTESVEKRVQSSVLEFPLHFTYRTQRINNFSAYAILGGKYGLDLQSQHKVEQLPGANAILKTKPHDFGIESGAGFNFYLPYFKFGIELKYTVGMNNLLIQDNSTYTQPLEHLRSRLFTVGFTFEG